MSDYAKLITIEEGWDNQIKTKVSIALVRKKLILGLIDD
jgi:hypothetical protein